MDFKTYFSSKSNYFFHWEDEAEVVSIAGGDTIGYRIYIAEILEKLAPTGIPRFASALLVLIATNPNGKANLNRIEGEIFNWFSNFEVAQNAFTFLGLLEQLPSNYKQKNTRILLLQALFSGAHNMTSVKKGYLWILQLKNKEFNFQDLNSSDEIIRQVAYQDLRVFELLLKQYPDVESIVNALNDLPSTEDVSIELEEETQDISEPLNFPDSLLETSETYHVGRLIKQLWGGLNIPFHNSLPSQQPIGGFADLTNKGDFDKLLISEFANDDLIFLSRLANNEVLYFNRESPPQNNDRERVILVDVTLKNWGAPKTIAMAIALAISYHPKTDINCSIFLVGDNVVRLQDKSIEGIIAGLKELSTSLNPIVGLEKVKEDLKLNGANDVFFISSAEVVNDREVQKFMFENKDFFKYLITTETSGNVHVHQYKNKTRSLVQHLVLPLKEAWKRDSSFNKKKISPQFETGDIPLLLSSSSSFKSHISTNGLGEYRVLSNSEIVVAEGSLTQKGDKGWKHFYSSPYQKLSGDIEIGQSKNGDYIISILNQSEKKLVVVNTKNNKKKTVFLENLILQPQFSVFYSSSHQHFYYKTVDGYFKFEFGDSEELEIQGLHPPEVEIFESEFLTRINGPINERFENHFPNVMRNIKQVYINTAGELVINFHTLRVSQNGNISLRQQKNNYSDILVEAFTEDFSTFTFPNGHTIHFNRLGFMVLSSESQMPYYEIELLETGPSKLALVKLLKLQTLYGLKDCKEWVDSAPSTISGKYGYQSAERLINAITKIMPEVKIEMKSCGNTHVFIPTILDVNIAIATEISFAGVDYFLPVDAEKYMTKFDVPTLWENQVKPFITAIINHGT